MRVHGMYASMNVRRHEGAHVQWLRACSTGSAGWGDDSVIAEETALCRDDLFAWEAQDVALRIIGCDGKCALRRIKVLTAC